MPTAAFIWNIPADATSQLENIKADQISLSFVLFHGTCSSFIIKLYYQMRHLLILSMETRKKYHYKVMKSLKPM